MRAFFFSYIGGKSKDLKYIMDSVDLSGIKTVIEPFCGSCAFSTSIKDTKLKYAFNDIDKQLVKFLEDVKDDKMKSYITYYNKHFKEYITDGKQNQKWRDLLKNKEITPKEFYLFRKLRGKCMMVNINNGKEQDIKDYEHLIKIFKKSELHCMDYKEFINKYINDKEAFIFLDPPYLDSYNASYSNYNGDEINKKILIPDNTKMFIDFMEILKNAKCKIMLIINGNALTRYLYKDYIKTSYMKRYDASGRRSEHLIITNY